MAEVALDTQHWCIVEDLGAIIHIGPGQHQQAAHLSAQIKHKMQNIETTGSLDREQIVDFEETICVEEDLALELPEFSIPTTSCIFLQPHLEEVRHQMKRSHSAENHY